jgi:D-alanyl-lipoteichoic acid acyltransferase DltB (MBOAT superfamily)
MLIALLCALLAAPLYWAIVPVRWRREAVVSGSLLALGIYDPRLLAALLVLNLALFGLVRTIAGGGGRRGGGLAVCGLLLLVVLFVWNKQAAGAGGVLPSQGGLVFLGLSYLVLKAAAALLDALRGAHRELRFRDLLAWMVFLPTYPSGPIEELAHFRDQTPRVDAARVLNGLERILFGLVKALVLSHQLGEWAGPILAAPEAHAPLTLLAGAYALTLRFYLDFAGYSDIAIGLAALFGYEISENFDNPLIRRNLVQLWQRWHMTLTAWLRRHLFIPLSRAIMRRGGPRWDQAALILAQLGTMVFCGLWHGLGWNFAAWGLLQALGLIWVGIAARDLGRLLPQALVRWWRTHPLAHALSILLTFNFFALSSVLVFSDLQQGLSFLACLAGS